MKKILIAAAAGAVIYHFLNSDKGQDYLKQAKKTICDLGDDLVQKGKDIISGVKDRTEAA